MYRQCFHAILLCTAICLPLHAQQEEGSDVAGAPSAAVFSQEESYETIVDRLRAERMEARSAGASSIRHFDFTKASREARVTPFWNALTANRVAGNRLADSRSAGASVFESFNVTLVDRVIELRWASAKQDGNTGFAVDRSFDGVRWEEIGFVERGQDIGTAVSYDFVDKVTALDLRRRTAHFRLRYQDSDKQYRKSQVVTITLRSSQRPAILGPNSPNPFRAATTMPFSLSEPEQAKMYLVSPLGLHVQRVFPVRFFDAGSHSTTFAAGQDIPPGIYTCVLETGNRSFRRTVAVGM